MRYLYPIFLGLSLPALANTVTVHPQQGNDLTGNGTAQQPFRTVSHALAVVQPGTTIVLQPGIYSTNSGERFPWVVRPGITLRGNEAQQGQGVVVSGGATFNSAFLLRPNITIALQDRTELRGLTVTNPNPRGIGIWQEQGRSIITNNSISSSNQDGILVTGTGTPTIISNRFLSNRGSNITIEGNAQPVIQQNIIERARFGITIRQQASPRIISNRIGNNDNGVMVQGDANPNLRGNEISNSPQTALIALNQSNPDLGTAQAPGQNTFRANGRDIHNNSSQTLSALGNQFDRGNFFGRITLEPNIAQAPPPTRPTTPRAALEPVPNSVVVRIAGATPRATAVNPAIDPRLPPVAMAPEGRVVTDTTPRITRRPALPLRFRVVVPVASPSEKNTVRQMLPGSFPLHRSGQDVVQVGAFNSIELARNHVQNLSNQGLSAIVEQISP